MKNGFVYLLASKRNGTMYVGATSDLMKRIYELTNIIIRGFTSKYVVHDLVYFKEPDNISFTIKREKLIKGLTRFKKIELIEDSNPDWKVLISGWSI